MTRSSGHMLLPHATFLHAPSPEFPSILFARFSTPWGLSWGLPYSRVPPSAQHHAWSYLLAQSWGGVPACSIMWVTCPASLQGTDPNIPFRMLFFGSLLCVLLVFLNERILTSIFNSFHHPMVPHQKWLLNSERWGIPNTKGQYTTEMPGWILPKIHRLVCTAWQPPPSGVPDQMLIFFLNTLKTGPEKKQLQKKKNRPLPSSFLSAL